MPKYLARKGLFHNNYLFLTIFSKSARKSWRKYVYSMSNSYFQFKQFTVWHDKCAMKVGTDGVLLGAWSPIENSSRILDVGTGTGLVALMLAQRSLSDTNIIALEINKSAAEQARENVERSPWKDRMEVVQGDFISYHSSVKFDAIVSNPPYFVNSLGCSAQSRNTARHNDSLTYEKLFEGVAGLLENKGIFTIVIPTDMTDKVKLIAAMQNLYAFRQLYIMTKPGGDSKRTLICFSFAEQECIVEDLLIEISRHQYSQEYIALTRDFYLRM